MTEEPWKRLGPEWRSIILISDVVREGKGREYIPTVPVFRKLRKKPDDPVGGRAVDPDPKGIMVRGDAALARSLGTTPEVLRAYLASDTGEE